MTNKLEEYFDRLWPICRSITGEGLRESFKILQEVIPLQLTEVPTGTKCFDWTIPKEWNIRDAYIVSPDGRKIAEFKVNNLHLVNYSVPVDKELNYDELLEHLHYIKEQPEAIPYYTSYYNEYWGFCISYNQFVTLPKEGKYRVFIDSDLKEGSLTYGDYVLKGETDEEIMFSSYLCHPSMANNELSGPLTMAFLYQKIKEIPDRKYTYRFVIAPETIGIIAYLSKYGDYLKEKLKAGYVLTCCGDPGNFTYQRSKQITTDVDRIPEHILKYTERPHSVRDFRVGGSDERQYCSPGFNLPVGSIIRTPYQVYPEYHTSLDNKDFISFEALAETIAFCMDIVRAFELNEKYYNTVQYCEPQLGKRGLYSPQYRGEFDRDYLHLMLHLLSFSDGDTSLLDIAEQRKTCMLRFRSIIDLALAKNVLLKKRSI